MKRWIAVIVCTITFGFTLSGKQESINSRRTYVKALHTDIYDITKKLDRLMHRKAFEHNPTSLKNLHAQIRDLRRQRDILMQHLRDLRRYGFSQIHQL